MGQIVIKCNHCGDQLTTSEVQEAIDFDRKHAALHPKKDEED